MAWICCALASNSCWSLRLRLQPLARVRLRAGVDLVEGRGQVRQHEGVRIFRAEKIAALLRQVGFVALLVHGEEQFFLLRVELLLDWSACSCSSALFISSRFSGSSSSRINPSDCGWPSLHAVEQQADLALELVRIRRIGAVLRLQLLEQLLGFAQGSGCTSFSCARTSDSTAA